ncbi:MAG: MFS transporter [Candidatus Tectomicrobia bacterium]|uniref:MFS transporter n=1 Tax=Tectimicrobiota bacterium TaxID=2528274 RepID=A0A938B3L2_UNCTE|nr:MFS transporter [Candidatus Tectomicrobia bacterium]
MTSTQQEAPQTYRWLILAAACTIGFMLVGARETLGNFLKPITSELHWDRETISLIAAINLWLSGLLQPFTGNIMDRFGPKWLFASSVTLYGVGVLLVGFTQTPWYLVLVYGVLVGSATAGSSISLSNALVAQWFPAQRRAFAISINNVFVALGRLALLYLSYYAMTLYGWRWSHIYLGVAILLVTIPAALLFPGRRSTERHQAQAARQRNTVSGPLEVARWSESLRSWPLWQLMGGYFVCGMTVNLSMHFIAFATDRGYQHSDAVLAQGTMSIVTFCGSLLAGMVSDRIGRKNVLGLAYAFRAVAFATLLLWNHWLALYVFAVIGGLSWLAAPPSVIALTGEIYGMRTLGTLGGISLLAHQIGGGLSVWFAGRLYDLTGGYDFSFTLATLALIGASLVSFSIAERRYSTRYLAPASAATGN